VPRIKAFVSDRCQQAHSLGAANRLLPADDEILGGLESIGPNALMTLVRTSG
jgi:hypothetical protein